MIAGERGTYEVLMTPAMVACPEAFMIRDFNTSAGEQTANGISAQAQLVRLSSLFRARGGILVAR